MINIKYKIRQIILLNTTNFTSLESDPFQFNWNNIRPIFALHLALAANNKNAITKNIFAIYRTAFALGIPLFKLNSFYNIKF